MTSRASVVMALGTAQTLAWASSYYLAAMLAAPMAADVHVSVPDVYAAFSAALVVSAILGPYAGRAIDRWGGRPVLAVTSLVFAAGLFVMSRATGPWSLLAGWLLLGAGMGSGLYEGAFAALVRLWGHDARGSITGVTLIAGFASTVGWPLSTWLEAHVGWRGACLTWAALHLLLGLPLNLSIPSAGVRTFGVDAPAGPQVGAETRKVSWGTTAALSFVFAVTWFISTSMAAHLPRLVQLGGASLATAVLVGALIGPSQVAARLMEFGFLRRVHPLLSARIAAALHPLGAAAFLVFGAAAAPVFGVLHGAGNGILTIAKGTLPLAVFGPQGYGHRQGILMVPSRIAQAFAPWVFGLLLDRLGVHALWVSSALALAALVALFLLRGAPKARDLRPVESVQRASES